MKRYVFMVNHGSEGWTVQSEYDTIADALSNYLKDVGSAYGSEAVLFVRPEITLSANLRDWMFEPVDH